MGKIRFTSGPWIVDGFTPTKVRSTGSQPMILADTSLESYIMACRVCYSNNTKDYSLAKCNKDITELERAQLANARVMAASWAMHQLLTKAADEGELDLSKAKSILQEIDG